LRQCVLALCIGERLGLSAHVVSEAL
jgi:hypothetical protein